MSFEYNGFVYRDLEPQVRYDAEQVELLKQADIKINERIDNIPLGAEKVSLTFPAGASEGTITNEQLATLQANEENYIEMVNDKELYYLNDPGHEEGFLTYSHVGIENSKATIKTLTITVSAKSFVIVTTVVPTESGGGGKLYRHDITITKGSTSGGAPELSGTMIVYNTSIEKLTKVNGSQLFFMDAYNNLLAYGVLYAFFVSDNFLQIYGVYGESGSSEVKLRLEAPITVDTVSDTVTEL